MTDEPLPASFGAERYRVERVLGEGAQATSFEAVDTTTGKRVVVKRFRVRGAKSWKEVELAEREAKVLAALDHPDLPRYVGHFEEGGELFLVTEHIEGESLEAIRKRGGRLAEQDVVRLLRAAAGTLAYLHGRAPAVVHRDIKPSNVLRRPDGSFAIIDFGAVRDRMKPEGGSTVVGTFGYMAPEQFQGRAMPASDVYAVGATALVLLTGCEPEALPHKGLAIDVEGALRGLPVSPWLVRALGAMLEPDPDKRAASITPLLQPPAAPPPNSGPPHPGGLDAWPLERRHGAREERRRERRDERDVRREERRRRWRERRDWVPGYGRPIGLGGPVGAIVHIALLVATLSVRLALRGLVLPLLRVLRLLIGDAANEASRMVEEAERDALEEIAKARAYTLGAYPAEAPAPKARVEPATPAVRVAPEKQAAPPEDPVEAEARAEAEAAAHAGPLAQGRRSQHEDR